MRRFRGVLLVAGPDHTLELNDSAEFMFRGIDGVRTVAEIGELVAGEYDVPLDTAVEDVWEFVRDLAENQIVTLTG